MERRAAVSGSLPSCHAQPSFSGGWATLKVYFQLKKKNKKEATSAAVRDAGEIYSGWSKGSVASSKGLR